MELLWNNAFYEIAIILGLAALVGGLGLLLRQPLIIAFLAVGVLAGPSGFHLVASFERIEVLAHIGIALLLFVVGLRLDLHLIRTLGPVALATGLGQVLFTSAIGFGIALALGMALVPALYVAVALTFSSTIIIVKLLSDQGEIDSLHGRIAIGFLIVQDLVAIVAMIALVAIGGAEAERGAAAFVRLALTGLGFLAAVLVAMRWLLPGLLRLIARNPELLALFAVAWAVLLAAGADLLGFSKEVGAFLAGVSLASTRYREAVAARLTTLRDFLLLFFFIVLGASLELDTIGDRLPEALLFSAFVLVGNPIIVMVIMGLMGYRRRTGFKAGLTVAQISEFSLILAALGNDLGHLDESDLGLITVVGLITICASTYLIISSDALYRRLEPLLRVFERRHPTRELVEGDRPAGGTYEVLLLGVGTYGGALAHHLVERRQPTLGIDFDPQALQDAQAVGLDVRYGDLADPDFLAELPLAGCRWAVSTLRDVELNRGLLAALRERGFHGRIALAAGDEADARALEEAGADLVLRPFADAAEQGADALTETARMLHLAGDWPVALRELRLPVRAVNAGASLRELPLYAEFGVTVLAVSRGGHITLNPGADFRIQSGDRLVLMGMSDDLRRAEHLLVQREASEGAPETPTEFAIADLVIGPDDAVADRSLAELAMRERLGITVIGIDRPDGRVISPRAAERLRAGDRVVVVGQVAAVQAVRDRGLG